LVLISVSSLRRFASCAILLLLLLLGVGICYSWMHVKRDYSYQSRFCLHLLHHSNSSPSSCFRLRLAMPPPTLIPNSLCLVPIWSAAAATSCYASHRHSAITRTIC
jgi:hypothetical protein